MSLGNSQPLDMHTLLQKQQELSGRLQRAEQALNRLHAEGDVKRGELARIKEQLAAKNITFTNLEELQALVNKETAELQQLVATTEQQLSSLGF